jgi:AhpD family alkylhydroperoxidase
MIAMIWGANGKFSRHHHLPEETSMPFFASMPEGATTKDVFRAYPEIYSYLVRASEAILRGPSPLSPGQRELIGAYVSALNACQYCYGGHRAAAELFGVDSELITRLTDYPLNCR